MSTDSIKQGLPFHIVRVKGPTHHGACSLLAWPALSPVSVISTTGYSSTSSEMSCPPQCQVSRTGTVETSLAVSLQSHSNHFTGDPAL